MDGVGSGGVYGEVTEQHLTIRKADKQRVSHRFGEVLTLFSTKPFSVDGVPLSEIASNVVADGF
ncbi:MAG: hypothetical protein J6M94_06425 [Prevotella sp.]|nr:hypothetical protein [Prevotella sp.]